MEHIHGHEHSHRHEHGGTITQARLTDNIPEDESFAAASRTFMLLSDTGRLRIFWLLCHAEECLHNISDMLSIPSETVSEHLDMLKENGLAESRMDGSEVYYKAIRSELTELLHTAAERMMELSCPLHTKRTCEEHHAHSEEECSNIQLHLIHEVHDYLTDNLSKRITIEELSHRFLINATWLKTNFKAVYGCSIAAHIKEHRMEKAAELLSESSLAVSEIAEAVGYGSGNKFSSAFQEAYGMNPNEYRKASSHHA